ncbi:S1 family peptidase [Streptomyces iconiensis]|uniref:S1 family peptidase n=1 Tax=Streptomyces iconiensis TaxID=1384038 RepID=A0ABT6ZVN4_9ACTN|nr:S1 family peptidase [Streptomyces iconiensis]MDJ1132493.1 S1 family peptidase [Streptomyces iconiensis]
MAAASGSAQAPAPATEQRDPGVRASTTDYALDSKIDRTLGSRSAGSYLDAETGKLVVTVTSESAAQQVRAAGAAAQRVRHSAADLRAAMTALDKRAATPGTSWGVDPRRNQVVVEADSTVSATALARLRTVAKGQDGAVRVTRVPGTFREEVLGGDAIYGGGVRCSAAFNVTQGSTRFFVTAGHCSESATNWSAVSGGPAIGKQEGFSFPGNDYSLVRYSDGSNPGGSVNLYNGSSRDITGAANAVVGQNIQKSGSTTKVTSGTVTATGVTVNYGSGNVVEGMVRTTACSAGGDSGGAHFSGGTALGIHSGSSGCTGTQGSAIHQPVPEALSAYGVSVY